MRLLKRIALEVLGPEKGGLVWSRMDIVGDILIIRSPRVMGADDPLQVDDYRKLAEEVMARLPYIRSVWLAVSPTHGSERLHKLVHLAGEKRTVTIYKEHGCRFKVDVAEVFVTPRLNYEHIRVARLVGEGERVVNMFAGAGIFSIIIACKARPKVVHSIDINPRAYELILENARLNKVEGIVKAYLGDAAQIVESELVGTADRVLMPLPALALEYLPHALRALEGSGWVHVYLHVRAPRGVDPVARAVDAVSARLRGLGARYRIAGGRIVRPVGPRLYQVVVDVEVERG